MSGKKCIVLNKMRKSFSTRDMSIFAVFRKMEKKLRQLQVHKSRSACGKFA
jgi:siderophore synthetase component